MFPGSQIDWRATPELGRRVKKSLQLPAISHRLGDPRWRINLWARCMTDGDHPTTLKFLLARNATYPDMFDAHPPSRFDGNFGGRALPEHRNAVAKPERQIEFLPRAESVARRQREGFARPLAASRWMRNWKDGKLVSATVRSILGKPLPPAYDDVRAK